MVLPLLVCVCVRVLVYVCARVFMRARARARAFILLVFNPSHPLRCCRGELRRLQHEQKPHPRVMHLCRNMRLQQPLPCWKKPMRL